MVGTMFSQDGAPNHPRNIPALRDAPLMLLQWGAITLLSFIGFLETTFRRATGPTKLF